MSFSGMNAFAATGLSFVVALVGLCVGVLIFALITSYQDWQEIKKGNLSASLATGGLILGLANIMRAAISTNNTPLDVFKWGGVGIVGLMIGWWLFDLLTPQFRTNDEILADNKAVGLVVFCIFIAVSLIVSACIS
ncbi:MAG: DUF350 domain-containing protein [Firmicutes bacterium]|nr:DUF350 domain-containing protein [Bacillota bacterium]